MTTSADEFAVSGAELEAVFLQKYGDPEELGWGPRMRQRFGYFNPDEHYEAIVNKLVTAETKWLDVGCGRELFPSNRALARELSERCTLLVGVDPDETLEENPFVHEKTRVSFEDYDGEGRFDLLTLRMVAEHVVHPQRVARALAKAVRKGGHVVIYTVNRFSPAPLLTTVVPFKLRHPIKRLLWKTAEKDTFPTAFKMNTRGRLRRILAEVGFEEVFFTKLDDCRTFSRFRILQWCELVARSMFRGVGLHYPENCIVGIYSGGEEYSVHVIDEDHHVPRAGPVR